MKIRDDARDVLESAGISDFPYVEVRQNERNRVAATRWPLLSSTNEVLGMGRADAALSGEKLPSIVPATFTVMPAADPEGRRIETAFPLLQSTRRFATATGVSTPAEAL